MAKTTCNSSLWRRDKSSSEIPRISLHYNYENKKGKRKKKEKEKRKEEEEEAEEKSLLVWSLNVQQHASVSQGRICSDNCTCCHTETEAADQTFYLTQSQHTVPTSSIADTVTPGAWLGSHWNTRLHVTGMTQPGTIPKENTGLKPRVCRSRDGRLNHWANVSVFRE